MAVEEKEPVYTLILKETGRVVMEHVKESDINYYKKWYAALGEIELEKEA